MTLYNYANQQAIRVKDDGCTAKKELDYNGKKALAGYLFDLFNANYDLFSELGIESVSVLYDNCMYQDNELRFFCGDGIDLGNGCRLDSIYLNQHGVLVMSVYDENDNEIIYC